jgi:AraC family transcriptional regulator, regulatory protein of adaptative response / DNA-3-methyladenine glycosylase II
VSLDPDACYRVLLARDARFDGLFFVGVSTTGIYCRPVCKARTPGRDRCTFYATAAACEQAGFRACLRCRPELAPGLAPVDALSRLVARAIARIDQGCLDTGSADDLAASLGVSGRHLRRAVEAQMGVSPIELAQSRRLAVARQLLADGTLPITQVAFASGFRSLRRFNALYRARCGHAPSAARKHRLAAVANEVTVRLAYRPPLDWEALLDFLGARAIPGVEQVAGGIYRRTVKVGAASGIVSVENDAVRSALLARVPVALVRDLGAIITRLRVLFDLDARPDAIVASLASDPHLGALVRARPGLRVPGAFDPFETAVRAVLGQQVSVRAATTLAGRLAAALGPAPLFPTAELIAAAGEGTIAALGMPLSRARTLVALARAVLDGRVILDHHADAEVTAAALQALPGIGPWTASYIALRALHWPDAFPAGDLGVRKALGGASEQQALLMAEPWRPWRGYAVMHLWRKDLEHERVDVLRQPDRKAHPGGPEGRRRRRRAGGADPARPRAALAGEGDAA